MADRLHFDEGTQTYTLQPSGIILPRVSSILAPIVDLSAIPKDTLDFARDRGKAVHRGCELLDLGTLDEDDLDEQLVPYIAAYAKFKDDWQPVWTAIEESGYHKTLLYAGTPDRRGWTTRRLVKGRIVDTGKPYTILPDLKATYELNPAVQVQLSGYDLMGDKVADELWSVRLKKDGTYERTVHKPAHSTFLSCLNIFNWKRKNA